MLRITGFPSSGYCAQFTYESASLTVAWNGTGGENNSGVATDINYVSLGLSGTDSSGSFFGVDAPTPVLHCTSVGDSDGYEGTSFLSQEHFSTEFIVPTGISHLAIGCAGQADVKIYNTVGGDTLLSDTTQGTPILQKFYTTTAYAAGTYITTSIPCMAVVDDAALGVEINMFGAGAAYNPFLPNN